jgi:hypothetical protein
MVRMKWRPVTSTLADATPGMASSCANTGARIEPQPRPGAGPQPKLREWKRMQRASAAVALMIAPPSMKDSWPLGGSRSRDAKVMKCRLPDGPILQTRPTPVHNQTYGASAQRCGSLPPDGTPRMQSSWRHLLHFRRRSLPVRGPDGTDSEPRNLNPVPPTHVRPGPETRPHMFIEPLRREY